MIYTPLTKRAMQIAYEKHLGQFDKSGIPYIYHPIHVAEQMSDENTTILALLHDVIEDTDTSIDDLKNEGFPFEVLEGLTILTKPDNIDYFDYVNTIKPNDLCLKVKIEDLKHNSDISRITDPTERDFKRVEKYKKALEILEN